MKNALIRVVYSPLLLWLIACTSSLSPSPIPTVSIDSPQNGDSFALEAILIQSQASDEHGIAQFELLVGDAVARVDSNPSPNAQIVRVEQAWIPPRPGEYSLRVRVQNNLGAYGISAPVHVIVENSKTATPTTIPPRLTTETPPVVTVAPQVPRGLPPLIILTPQFNTRTPTFTRTSTLTRTPTLTRTNTPTNTPTFTSTATPSGTPEIQFYADSTVILRGQCTILHWRMQYALAVILNNEPVTENGYRQVCPTTTTNYILHVSYSGVVTFREITIQVITLTITPTSTRTTTRLPTRTTTPGQ